MSINQPVPELACHHARWKKNRDFCSGRDAVVKAGDAYIPPPVVGMTNAEFQNFLKRVGFYPACVKVIDGWMGLIFRERPDLIGASDKFKKIQNVITADGNSLEEFATGVVRETLQTNWTGVLEDHSPRPEEVNLNAANALELGFRPYLSMFPAESILEVRYGIVDFNSAITYARLLQDEDTVIELRLVKGVYSIQKHVKTAQDQWKALAPTIPERDGKPLNRIPFKIITTRSQKRPSPAPFEHMVDLNCEIWVLAGELTQALKYCANPIVRVQNVSPEYDEEGNEIERKYNYGPGVVWEFVGDVDVEVTEFKGDGVKNIQSEITEKKSQLARTGARILQDDRAAPEATETITIRQTADNAALAGLVQSIANQLQDSVRNIERWLGTKDSDKVTFQLNTDFSSNILTPAEIEMAGDLYDRGFITDEIMFNYLKRDGGPIDKALSFEQWMDQRSQQVADRPTLLAPPADTPANDA